MNKKLDAVIFDLDGTLLDTLDDLTAATGAALGAVGYAALDRTLVRRFVGNGVKKLIERALFFSANGRAASDAELVEADPLFDKCMAEFTAFYDKHNADRTKPYVGIAEMLAAVKAKGLKTAIVTNKYDAAAQALKHRFFACVDVAVGAADGIRPKPAPDGVYKALELLGAQKERAVYVGDGETDVATAKACGMPVVAVTWGFRDETLLRTLAPDRVISAPDELVETLERDGWV